MADYDICGAFKAIEDELIASMMRNMKSHRAWEEDEGFHWEQWQALQLKALDKYKKQNQKKYGSQFKDINKSIEVAIQEARLEGGMDQEIKILRAIKNGFKGKKVTREASATFFKLNDRKLDALIKATTQDMQRAETAVLRMANDQYRKAIFNAQAYANSGAGTYEKAVDMATKDFLSAGLNCVEYKNGARHTLSDYADMAIRTASKRAYLQGEGEKRKEWGISTVIMNKRGNPCPKCLPWVGKILIDDVWSGGKAGEGDYPLMSTAIAAGLYHPRCKDSHTTYFPGISTPPDDKFSREELSELEKTAKHEAKQQYASRQADKFGRMAKYSLDEENQEQYRKKEKAWRHVRFRTGDMDSKKHAESKRPLANFHAVPQEKIVNILREDSKDWIKQLTSDEKRAIRKYTYNSGDRKPDRFFEKLNAMLRGDLPEEEWLKKYADTISGAVKKNKLRHDVICYRNMEFNPYEKYVVGDIVTEKQFISTSVTKNAALDKNFKILFFVSEGSRAAYIESISRYPKQRELLLDKGCKLRVLSKKEDSIILEVIK